MAKNVLGQYFTPSHIARIMVDLIESPRESKILEPSAGEGVFLDVLHEAGYSNIEGIEIDSSLKQNVMHTIYHESFVSWMTGNTLPLSEILHISDGRTLKNSRKTRLKNILCGVYYLTLCRIT